MSIRTKAASLGVAAIMVASLAGAALADSTVSNTATPTGPVVRAAGFVGTASYTFTENAVNQFPAGGFVLTIDISDAQGGRTVHFDKTASSLVLSPDSLALSAAFSTSNDYTLVITSLTSNIVQNETLGIGGLKVKADGTAALGAIRTRYSLNTAAFDLGGKGLTTSTGRISGGAGAPSGAGTFDIALDAGSPLFTNDAQAYGVTPDTDGNGPIVFTDGANTESAGTVVAGAVALGVQTITSTQARTYAHAQFTPVSQTHALLACNGGPVDPIPAQSFGVCALASIGTVVDSVAADAPNKVYIQRGLVNSQPWVSAAGDGRIFLNERTTGAAGNGSSSGYIAAGSTITLTLDPALGVKFSVPPTATSAVWAASSIGTTTALTGGAATVATVTPGASSVADPFGTTAAATAGAIGFSNLYVNDSPVLFENKAVTEGAANVLTPAANWTNGHAATTAVGQDRIARTDGTALGLQVGPGRPRPRQRWRGRPLARSPERHVHRRLGVGGRRDLPHHDQWRVRRVRGRCRGGERDGRDCHQRQERRPLVGRQRHSQQHRGWHGRCADRHHR